MKSIRFVILLVCIVLVACQDTSPKTVTVSDTSYEVIEDVVEPPPNNVETLVSISDWFRKIIAEKPPTQTVDVYIVGISSAFNHHIIFLQGMSKRVSSPASETNEIIFIPVHSYAKLPESYTKGLDQAGLLEKLAADIGAYTQTSAFHQSFLAKANAIVLETNSKVIWKK